MGQAGEPARRRGAGHAEHDGAVAADHGDCLVNLGALGSGQVAETGRDAADKGTQAADLLAGGHGVGCGPPVDAAIGGVLPGGDREGGGEALAGTEQVIKIGGQVGEVGGISAEVIAADACLRDLRIRRLPYDLLRPFRARK